MNTSSNNRNFGFYAAVLASFWIGASVWAHNLDTGATSIHFADDFLATMSARAGLGQAPVQVGDEFWVVVKTTPGPGTDTGVGGYQTLYIPPGVQVLDAAHVLRTSSDPRGFVEIPIKGQSPIAIGDGPVGASSATGLTGFMYPGPNVLGVNEAPVTAGGVSRGTVAGVYADTGIFYSTDPRTEHYSYTGPVMNNNSGDDVGELVNGQGSSGVTTLWDSSQLRAFGRKDVSPIIDTGDGRGNAPWGMASAVAGPQSGYQWSFDGGYYDANPGDPNRIRNAIETGPWNRIQYPGSQISSDQAGLESTTLGYAGIDGSTVGYDLNPANPLERLGDGTGVNAVRFAIGQLEIGKPLWSAVKLKIIDPIAPNCYEMYADAFGGDAGGTSNGKDHIWRYFDPTVVTLSPCVFLQKQASKSFVVPGETFSYTITFANNGSFALPNVTITDSLPSGVNFISAVPAPDPSSSYTWSFGTVAPNEVKVITLYVEASGSGTLSNQACVESNGSTLICATETVESRVQPYLVKSKSASTSNVTPGGSITYTMTVENIGTGPSSTPLILTDYLPAGFTYQSLGPATINGASFVPTVDATDPTIPIFEVSQSINAGNELVIEFTALVGATVPTGEYCNGLEIESDGIRQGPVPDACITVGGGQIGDTIYRDWDGDGIQDTGEEGISGVSVALYNDVNGDGVFDGGDTLADTTTTDANGNYLFTGLTPGDYVVVSTPPAGYINTGNPPGGVGDPLNEGAASIVGPNDEVLTVDFGYQYDPNDAGAVTIGDLVFSDLNKDGLPSAGEPGIPDVTVDLYEDTNGNGVIDAGDLLIQTAATGPTGLYQFTGLDPNVDYIADVDGNDPDISTFFGIPFEPSSPDTVSVTSFTGSSFDDADFGFFGVLPATIGDQVFLDENGDGIYNTGDLPIANVTVEIYQDTNGDGIINEPVFDTAVTDLNGQYLFDDLGAGTYIVKVLSTDPDLPPGVASPVSQQVITVASNDIDLTADFPYVKVLDKTVDKSVAGALEVLTYTINPYYPGGTMLTPATITDDTPVDTTYSGSANPTPVSEPTIGATGTVEWDLGSTVAAVDGAGSKPGISPNSTFQSTTTEVDDLYINEDKPAEWKGGDNALITNPDAGATVHSLMKFTLPSLDPGDSVERAFIRIFLSKERDTNHTITLRRLTTAWTEGTSNANGATWNDPNGTGTAGTWAAGTFSASDYDGTTDFGTFSAPFLPDTVLEFDVTDLVQDWRDATYPNYGVVLVATGTDNGDMEFISSEGNDVDTLGPRLIVSYTQDGSGTETIRDNFGTSDYENNDGSHSWAGSWVEIGDDGAPGGGDLRINGGILRVADADGLSVYREVNLLGATNAVLTYDLTLNALDNALDVIKLQGSTNGGGSWTDIQTFTLGTALTGYSHDLISVLGSVTEQTQLRFVRISSDGGKKNIELDNFQISFTTPPGASNTTALSVDTGLMTGTRNVAVQMTVASTEDVAVTPPGTLTVATTGTASASYVSGPTPASGTADADGVTFSYVYQVISGASPGSVIFSGTPTGPVGTTFGEGFSQSILTGPPLTFTVTVDAGATVDFVENVAEFSSITPAQSRPPQCFAVADAGGGGGGDDRLVVVDGDTGTVTDVGDTGTFNIEAIEWDLPLENLYAIDEDTLGTLNLTNGTFTAVSANTIASVTNPMQGSEGDITAVDADAMSFDPITGDLYAVQRQGGLDLLFILSPVTGEFVPDAFGGGVDYVAVDSTTLGLDDIDGIGFDPVLGTLYAILAEDGINDRLITIDKSDGSVTDISAFTNAAGTAVTDVEGISFESGTLRVITGGSSIVPAHRHRLWEVDPATGLVTELQDLQVNPPALSYDDYESVGCRPALDTPAVTNVPPTLSPLALTALTASIGDFVWYDLDGDGVQDPGEPGIAGITVRVYADADMNGIPDGPAIGTAVTDTAGNYAVYGLGAGDYIVDYDPSTTPAGYFPTTPGIVPVYGLLGTQQYVDADFGLKAPEIEANDSIIGDTLWLDADENGVVDSGELLLANVDVRLYQDVNANGIVDFGDVLIETQSTDANGNYLFTGLYTGDYVVDVDETDPDLPLGIELVSGGSPVTTPPVNDVHAYTITTNNTEIFTADFGYNYAGQIGDTIFYDDDQNGIQGDGIDGNGNEGEDGAFDVTIVLYNDVDNDGEVSPADTVAGIAFTDANGNYLFDNLPPGNYVVKVDEQTVESRSTPGLYSTMLATTGSGLGVSLTPGDMIELDADFGFVEAAELEGHVFHDINHNGVFESGETPLEPVTVNLYGPGLDGIIGTPDDFADLVATTTTDLDGEYKFLVSPGDYRIAYDSADPDALPTVLTDVTTPQEYIVTAVAGGEYGGFDFGVDNPGQIGDTIFADVDSSGTKDLGEAGLANVTVTLYQDNNNDNMVDAGDTLLEIQLTDSNGEYLFEGLADGDYVVEVNSGTLPAGYQTTTTAVPPTESTLGTSEAGATISGGNTLLDRDFGYPPAVATFPISGTVWNDNGAGGGTAGDGVFDAGEPGISNVTVTISVDDDGAGPNPPIEYVLTTDANGDYSLTGVPAGAEVIVTVDDGTLPSEAFVQTGDPDATLDHTNSFTMPAAPVTNKDFGYEEQFGSIAGTVVEGDGDGQAEPGENPLYNVPITLVYAGPDGIFGTGDETTNTTTTAVDGSYSFGNLVPGNYRVEETDLAGYTSIADADGANPNSIDVISLQPNENVVTRDFEDVVNDFVLGDRIWLDEDGDGVQDAGESGIANVIVELYDATGTILLATTTTDSEGNYLFRDLAPGDYTVSVDTASMPAGLAANPTYDLDGTNTAHTTSATIAPTGEGNFDVDFGYNWAPNSDVTGGTNTGAIGDRVWLDGDEDGQQDPGEPGLAGVSVFLSSAGPDGIFGTGDDPAQLVTVTAPDGSYIFDDLPAGVYKVGVAPPANHEQTGDPDPFILADNQTTVPIVLAPGDVYLEADFGYMRRRGNGTPFPFALSPVGDQIWLDLNGDGILNGSETGIPGVSVALIQDANGNGVFDAGESIISTTQTDANGLYLFNAVPALPNGVGTDDYVVWVNDTAGVLTGLTPTYDSDGIGTPNLSVVTDLNNMGNLLQDFGYRPPDSTPADGGSGVIGDTIFLDRDGDNIADAGEGLEGVQVSLYDATGTILLAATTTDENGNYYFTGLVDATYTVKVDTTSLPGTAGQLTNTFDPDGGTANEAAATIAGGNTDLTRDFGYQDLTDPNTIGGTIWDDVNADGTLSGETNFYAGVTVVLYDDQGNVVATTTTDSNGDYSFAGLPDGSYTVDVTDEANVLNGLWKSDGANPGVDNNSQVDPYSVTVSGGVTDTTADFGYYGTPAAIGNFVWDDLNGDGIQDGGEPGLSGVVVTLTITWPNGGGSTVLSTTTDGSGFYSFGNLLADENHDGVNGDIPIYTVDVGIPAGYIASPVDAGGDDTADSDAHAGATALPTLGLDDVTVDFGLTPLGTIIGTVFVDEGTKGNKGPEDTDTLSGITITLFDANSNLVATTTTGIDGSYTFTNVVPGDYIVRETDSGSYVSTTDTDGGSPHATTVTVAPKGTAQADFWDTLFSTYVLLSDFGGAWSEGRAILHWQTASEVGTIGFFLSRSETADGTYTPVTDGIIPGLITSPQGGSYQQWDPAVEADSTWFYRLQEVDALGKRTDYGPFEVSFEAGRTARSTAAAKRTLRDVPATVATAHKADPAAKRNNVEAQQSRAAQAQANQNQRVKNGADSALRFEIDTAGLQQLDLDAVAADLGISVGKLSANLKRRAYRLTHRGETVAYHLKGNQLWFYAAPLADTYTADDVYWLEPKKGGLIMNEVNAGLNQVRRSSGWSSGWGNGWGIGWKNGWNGNNPAGDANIPGTFTEVTTIEENHGNYIHLYDEVDDDYWYWDFLLAGNATRGVKSFSLPTPGLAGGAATLVVNLHGYTSLDAEPEHHAVIELNGQLLGEVIWDGAVPQVFTAELPDGLLVDGDNTVTITAVLDAGVPYGAFVLEDFEVTYARRYEPAAGILALCADQTGTIEVTGLSSEDVTVLDITDVRKPAILSKFVVEADGESWKLRFRGTSGHDYLVVEAGSAQAVDYLAAATERPLLDHGNRADYVIVVPEGLEAGAQELADYREAQGLNVKLVRLQEIYDTFNHGLSSPHAIRAFLKHAHEAWRVAPRYVVLAGSATYDYKDYMGLGGNLVPAIMVPTPFGLFASDAAMADFDGDGAPEVALGRLPALSNEELIEQLLKIMEYENSNDSWKQNIALVADNNDEGGNFHSSSDGLDANLGAAYTREKIYLGELPKAEARTALLDALANGSGLINYVGHGGADRVTAEGLLLKSDVPGLTNADRPSVMVALTCSIGRFEMPGYDSLGEDLVRHDGGGAVAVWAPSGLSINDRATELGDAFLKAVYQDGVGVMGDAILQASAAYGEGDEWISYIYNLMGDPALRLLPANGGSPANAVDAGPLARRSVEASEAPAEAATANAKEARADEIEVAARAEEAASAVEVLASYESEAAGIVKVASDQSDRVGVRIDGVDVASLAMADGLIFYVPLAGVQVDLVLNEAAPRMQTVNAAPIDTLEAAIVTLDAKGQAAFATDADANTFVVGFEGLPVVLDVSDPLNPQFVLGVEVEHDGVKSVYFHLPEGAEVLARDL